MLIQNWKSALSLRVKITGVSLLITMMSLAFVAVVVDMHARREINSEQRRSVDSVAFGFARAAELAVAAGDQRELGRLCQSFLHDDNVVFVAAYGHASTPLGVAIRDSIAWEAFQKGRIRSPRYVVGVQEIEEGDNTDEFAGNAEIDAPAAVRPSITTPSHKVGRVVIGMSTVAMLNAQRRQERFIVAVSICAAGGSASILFLALGTWLYRLRNLVDAAQSISQGDFSDSVADHHQDEIGRLARSFEEMRVALQHRDQNLQQFTETLQDQVQKRTLDLRTALSAAEEASRTKSLFLANMSHELRTPLNGVIGMVDLMLAAEPNTQQRRYCDVAKSSARSLLELINDILDFSKIEAGKLEMETAPFDLHEAIESVAGMFGERAEKKKIELICGLSPDVPRMVNGDPVRLRQVLMNLISNALKFTERGEVVIRAALEEQGDSFAVVKMSVKDSGIGIPPDRIKRLFQSFSQVDASTTRKFGGTGLGLAISQRIVEMMKGVIGVESEEGEGSTFWFTVRLEKCSQVFPVRSLAQVDPRGLRALAVDDNLTNREILRGQLESWHLLPDVAESAAEALEMLKRANLEGKPYRFAILDMHMPETDGQMLARMIKTDPALRNVILISLSSIGDRISPSAMREMGFAACLTKPALPSFLYDAIVRSLACDISGSPEVPETRVAIATQRLDGMNILLAEDNEINQMVAAELIQQAGATCSIAADGTEAIEKALHGDYDVILMDCQMPVIDGFEATRRIRQAEAQDPLRKHRPIVALTANAIKGDRELCLESGMDGYITKPIDPPELFRTILLFAAPRPVGRLSISPAAGAADGAPPSPVIRSTANALSEAANQEPPVDVKSLQKRCMGNRKLAAKTLSRFQELVAQDVNGLIDGISAGNSKASAASAHKIKGAAANISAEPIRSAAAEIEKLAREDRLDQTETCVKQLQEEIDRFRQYLTTALGELGATPPTATGADTPDKPRSISNELGAQHG